MFLFEAVFNAATARRKRQKNYILLPFLGRSPGEQGDTDLGCVDVTTQVDTVKIIPLNPRIGG